MAKAIATVGGGVAAQHVPVLFEGGTESIVGVVGGRRRVSVGSSVRRAARIADSSMWSAGAPVAAATVRPFAGGRVVAESEAFRRIHSRWSTRPVVAKSRRRPEEFSSSCWGTMAVAACGRRGAEAPRRRLLFHCYCSMGLPRRRWRLTAEDSCRRSSSISVGVVESAHGVGLGAEDAGGGCVTAKSVATEGGGSSCTARTSSCSRNPEMLCRGC